MCGTSRLTLSLAVHMPLLQQGYNRLPPWIQDVALSAYGLRLRWLRYGAVQRRHLEELMALQWLSAEDQAARQNEQLRQTLNAAYRSVPFYRERGSPPAIRSVAELRALPIISKAEVRAAGRLLVSEGSGRLTVIHTGGSTGTPLSIYCNRSVLQSNYAFFERLKLWAGVPHRPRVATFAGRNIVRFDEPRRFWRHNHAMRTLLLSSYHISPVTVSRYADALGRFRPQLIDSYPSSLEPIARHLIATGRNDIRPTAVITSSETLFPETRALLERAFGCRVFDQYGSAEMVAFIGQCERGSYHVNPEYGVIELLHNDEPVGPGETGDIVATGFVNSVMPLIRYRLGDRATWGQGPCGCGRAFPVIERIEGRVDDVIITPDGKRVGRLDPIFKVVESAHESRIVQDALDHITVETVTDAGLPEKEEALLRQELMQRLGPAMRIDFRSVPRIPRTAGGKLRTVISVVSDEGFPVRPTESSHPSA